MPRPPISFLLALPLVACGGDGQDQSETTDASAGGGGEVDAMPDAAELVCDIEPSYSGALFEPRAFVGNENNPDLRFLALNANLEAGAAPDRLVIVAFASTGIETGAFPLDGQTWSVSLCVDFDPDGFPTCREQIEARGSGTLAITSIEGQLTGSLSDAEFRSESQPGCVAEIAQLEFDEPIE